MIILINQILVKFNDHSYKGENLDLLHLPMDKSVSTTNDSNFRCKAQEEQTAGLFGSSREKMGFLWLQVIGHRKRVSQLHWIFRSFYFSNNWEMLNTEQIKMPQSKLQNTGYQPVEALFFPLLPAVVVVVVVQFLIVCSSTLARSVCTKS